MESGGRCAPGNVDRRQFHISLDVRPCHTERWHGGSVGSARRILQFIVEFQRDLLLELVKELEGCLRSCVISGVPAVGNATNRITSLRALGSESGDVCWPCRQRGCGCGRS